MDKYTRAHQIIAGLRDTTYAHDYQVTYGDEHALAESIATILDTVDGVTTPDHIRNLSNKLARIASGADETPIVITGNCSELVVDPLSAAAPTRDCVSSLSLIDSSLLGGDVLHIHRGRGQNTKPRSSAHETVDGVVVQSYMGDSINSPDHTARQADPQKLVDAAMQALVLERNLTATLGNHIPAAHEALNLYYEHAFISEGEDGKRYLLSADLPWVGVRTNSPDSLQVELLSGIENPVGVKVGKETTRKHLEDLSGLLNPSRQLGKIAWMLRVGLEHRDDLNRIVKDIVDIEESPIILYDIHGSTIHRADGVKIRATERISAEIEQLYAVCAHHHTPLNGLHLETTAKDRRECVETIHQTPTHEGCVDPQLNRHQTEMIVNGFAKLRIA